MFLDSMLLIPLMSREVGKNIRVKGRRGRTGALFLVSMWLITLLRGRDMGIHSV